MICKACGHNNPSTAIKCASCGTETGNNEMFEMFQAQAQVSKGIDVKAPASGGNGSGKNMEPQMAPSASAQAATAGAEAEDFFGDFGKQSATKSSGLPPKQYIPPKRSEETANSFFAQMEQMDSAQEQPAFETQIGSLRNEELPPEDHPLFSPPTNAVIESYIARRAKAAGKLH